jgi:hypothetical protein
MYWLVQRNFYSESNHDILVYTLDRLAIPFKEVTLINGELEDCYTIVETALSESDGRILTCGSSILSAFAKSQGWIPGSFVPESFNYTFWIEAYGEYFLNFDAVIGSLGSIEPEWSTFFIRPSQDNKNFNGSVVTEGTFNSWRSELLGSSGGSRFTNTEVIIAPLRILYAEYRFFVVDGLVISYSQYKSGNKPFVDSILSEEVIKFAEKMVSLYQPSRAFVLDIASTPRGFKVVELNTINSSGFYACNVGKIVSSLDNMDFTELLIK